MYDIYSDIPRLYTAIAEWLACLTYCLVLKRRVSGVKFVGISAAALVIQSTFLVTTKSLHIYLWLPCMLTAALLMYLFMCIVVEDTKITIEVLNSSGVELPSTGGPGTRLFAILGGILTLGAGVLLWRRRSLI